jgi:hypothetical protein
VRLDRLRTGRNVELAAGDEIRHAGSDGQRLASAS